MNDWSQKALGPAAKLDRTNFGAVEYPRCIYELEVTRVEVNISMDKAEQLAAVCGVSLVGLLGKEASANFRTRPKVAKAL